MRTPIVAVVAGVVAMSAVAVAAPAGAAARNPGLYGPTKAMVGQEVTFTSVFLAKDRPNICFSPIATWGEPGTRPGIDATMCMKLGSSGKYEREVDTFTQTFSAPGTYTLTVTAAGVKTTGLGKKAGLARVKGPTSYTKTIVVTADPNSPTPEATTTDGASS